MLDLLKTPFTDAPAVSPWVVAVRLLLALALGGGVAWIHQRTRRGSDASDSLPATLVLLAVLIAMVTQVIGDNIARAFSLVGALSIVRFRTVVRDTQDTAYVIFAVVVGMAVGARDIWVALIGIGVTGLAAFLMMKRTSGSQPAAPLYLLNLRVGLGHDFEKLLGATLDAYLRNRQLVSVSTSKNGIALDVIYHAQLAPQTAADQLIIDLNKNEIVQRVEIQRRGIELE